MLLDLGLYLNPGILTAILTVMVVVMRRRMRRMTGGCLPGRTVRL